MIMAWVALSAGLLAVIAGLAIERLNEIRTQVVATGLAMIGIGVANLTNVDMLRTFSLYLSALMFLVALVSIVVAGIRRRGAAKPLSTAK